MQAEWQERLLPISFTLDGLYLISRREEQPFEVRHFVPFGEGKKLPIKHQRAFDLVNDICEAILVKYKPLHVTGSAQFGTLSEGSDLDLLCIGAENISHEEFFAEARELLTQNSDVSEVRSVEEAMVPVLKAKIDGIPIDVTYARVKGERAPQYSMPLDDISKISLAGYLEIDEIIKVTQRKFAEDDFKKLLLWVTNWAKNRQIYGNRLGFIGGFSWAVLSAAFLQKKQRFASFEAMVQGFLQEYAEWPWPSPVCLSDAVRARYMKHEKEPMPILTPLVPSRNSARNVCQSTLQVLKNELQRAAHLAKAESLESALQPVSFDVSKKHLSLSLEQSNHETEGFVESRLVGLYVLLEALQVEVRPFFALKEGPKTTWRIQLNGSPSEPQLEQATQRFTNNIKSHLPEVKLTFHTLYAT
jgi:poly(A) polymerase